MRFFGFWFCDFHFEREIKLRNLELVQTTDKELGLLRNFGLQPSNQNQQALMLPRSVIDEMIFLNAFKRNNSENYNEFLAAGVRIPQRSHSIPNLVQ